MQVKNLELVQAAVDFTTLHGTKTIQDRAIPDIRDGLKPSQRRILWGMYKLGLFHNTSVKKSSRVVGETMAKYHPHGDMSLYTTMVNLVNCAEPLIFGQGNWGNYNEPAAAHRYTECRLSEYSCKYLLDPVYLHCIPMVSNYDGEDSEPVYLPAKLPNILINGAEGIATAVSTVIPSFSRESVTEIVKIALSGKSITSDICVKTLKFNYAYGGNCIATTKELLDFFKTGSANLSFEPEYTEKTVGAKIVIHVNSIAPRFNVESKFMKISEIPEVVEVSDKSSGGKILFEIILKDNEDAYNKVIDLLETSFPCQTKVTIRKEDGEGAVFKETNIPTILNNWVRWRIKLESEVVKYLLGVERAKLDKQELIKLAILNKEVIIQALNEKDPTKFLVRKLHISTEDAEFILDLKVRQLAKLEVSKIDEKIASLKKEISILRKDSANIEKRILSQLE